MNEITLEQQNILSLFNTKDPVNMEMAETIAISTGNGQWFNEYIDAFAESLSKVLEKYFYYLSIYYSIKRGLLTCIEYLHDLKSESKMCAYALITLGATCWRDYDTEPCYGCEISILKDEIQSLSIRCYFADKSLLNEFTNHNILFTYDR